MRMLLPRRAGRGVYVQYGELARHCSQDEEQAKTYDEAYQRGDIASAKDEQAIPSTHYQQTRINISVDLPDLLSSADGQVSRITRLNGQVHDAMRVIKTATQELGMPSQNRSNHRRERHKTGV